MTELLLGNDVTEDGSVVNELLAKARLAGRFEWQENCGVHSLVYTGNPKGRLYEIKLNNPFFPSFLRFPSAGKQVDAQTYEPYAKFRLMHDGVEQMRTISAAELMAKLPSLEAITERCALFEIGLAYHIGDKLVSDVALYSKRA